MAADVSREHVSDFISRRAQRRRRACGSGRYSSSSPGWSI